MQSISKSRGGRVQRVKWLCMCESVLIEYAIKSTINALEHEHNTQNHIDMNFIHVA